MGRIVARISKETVYALGLQAVGVYSLPFHPALELETGEPVPADAFVAALDMAPAYESADYLLDHPSFPVTPFGSPYPVLLLRERVAPDVVVGA